MMKVLRYALALCLLVLAGLPAVALATVTVTDAWVPEAPPVSTVLVAYMTIHNSAADDVRIVGAQSEQFAAVQMHLSILEKGVAKMLPQKILIVPANEDLQLKQAGYHLMLINPVAPLTAGHKVALTLNLADGSKVPVVAEVKKHIGEKSKSDQMQMKKDGSHRCY